MLINAFQWISVYNNYKTSSINMDKSGKSRRPSNSLELI